MHRNIDTHGDAKQNREWSRLYEALAQTLANHGQEDPDGNGDYWLVEDNWGGSQQKVCVFKMSFLTPSLVHQVQRLLIDRFPTWSAIFALDVTEGVHRIQDQGIEVFADRVTQQWDKEKLRKLFGENFRL